MTGSIANQLGTEIDLPNPMAPSEREKLLRLALASNFQRKHTPLPPITPVGRDRPMPLSFAQQRLWFLAQMEGGSQAYHMPLRLKLKGALDRAALRRALDRIVARHEALRTCFHQLEGEPLQQILPPEDSRFLLVEHDLSEHPERGAELDRFVNLEAVTPFNLATGPLLRGRLLRMQEDDYAFLLTLHHIASDGWSTGLLAEELETLYEAFRRGEEDPLAPLKIQYADYSFWQRQWIETGLLREQKEYWESTLKGAPMLLEVPADHPRPVQQSYEGSYVELVLDAKLTERVKAFSQRNGTTVFMTLLAAWAALLSRLAVQQDVVIGTPTANRGYAEIEELIGLFSNTIALRLELSGSPTVRDLLQRVKQQAIAAQHHQDLPFEQVVEVARPVRSIGHTPIFQVMFIWGNNQQNAFRLPGVDVQRVPTFPVGAKFDLSLGLREFEGTIKGSLQFATSLFERPTMERYLGYFRTLLEGLVSDENAVVDRLSMLGDSERDQLLYEWNDTAIDFPAKRYLHELLEEQVKQAPESIALQYAEEQVSYRDLNGRANQLARSLRRLGVGPECRVAVCLERGCAMVVAMLAVLKAGGAYVPLDTAAPADRLQFMVQDSGPLAVLTEAHLKPMFEGVNGLAVIDLETMVCSGEESSDLDRDVAGLRPDNLAYLIYTSGSTGVPKGVEVTQGAVSNFLGSMRQDPGMSRDDVLLAVTTISFDIAALELFLPLSVGARVVLASRKDAADAGALAASIARHGVTVMQATPATWHMLVAAGWQGEKRLRILCGGDQLRRGLVDELLGRSGGLWNLFGPTETTIWSTAHRVGGGQGSVPIGRPIANTKVYLLDAAGEPVPVGVSGELYIGGAGLARGYHGRPDLTAERFVPDPFGELPGGRLYRTGDLARYLADGTLEYLGRNDFQVKIRGFRIELGEIEARLVECAGVSDAVVVAREDTPGSPQLVAYYVATGGEALHAGQLRAHLAERLPEYMVPAAYVRLEALPLTANGKLDRKALPAADRDAFATRDFEPPQGETETLLAAIWADVLKVERVGREDNFFALGGHSLLATRVITRVRRKFDVDLPVREVFTFPVLSALADKLLTVQLEQFNEADIATARNQLQLQ
jgi:amino acid adenylation domain-containing protein